MSVVAHWTGIAKKARYHLVILGLFFLGAMHYQEDNPGGVGLSIPANAVSWIVVSMMIGGGLLKIARSRTIVYTGLTCWLLLCVVLMSIPTLYPGARLINESPVHLGLLGGFLFFLALQQYRPGIRDFNVILLLILGGVFLEILFAWKQYLGISLAGIAGPGAEIPFGTVRQRNVMATFLVTGVAISAVLLQRDVFETSASALNKAARVFCLLTPVLAVPLLIVLESRTGWVALFISTLLILPVIWQAGAKRLALVWTLSLLAGLCVVPVLEQFSDSTDVVPFEKLNLEGVRNYMYGQVLGLALEKPFTGMGFGTFESAYNLHAAQGYAEGIYDYAGYGNLNHPHNELLYWWVEGGLVALAGVLLAAVIVVMNIFRAGGYANILVLLALFFPVVFHTQVEMPFFSSVFMWVIFLLLILYVDVHTGQFRSKAIDFYLLPMAAGVIIPLLVTAFMVSTIQSGRLLNRIERDLYAEVSILENITNPVVWQDRLLWDMNFGLLALAIYQDRPELAFNYIEWASQIIKRKPRAGYYQFLVIAYKVVGDDQQAELVQREAEFRFPDKDFNFNLDAFVGIENRNIDDIQVNLIEE